VTVALEKHAVRVILGESIERRDRVSLPEPRGGPAKGLREWRKGLPELVGRRVSLRELRQRDAPALLKHLGHESALTYVAGAPRSLDGLRRFIRWGRAQRQAGTHLTFGVVPAGQQEAVGLVQLWPIERDFSTAEWGFVIGEAYQGSGLFTGAATLLLDFAFLSLGVMRLEARAVVEDGRSNRALQRLGATCEGRLRAGFRSSDVVLDHVMWSILAPEWPARQADHRTRRGAEQQ